jgi:hypothetical protein
MHHSQVAHWTVLRHCGIRIKCPQEVVQSARITPHEADVTSSNPHSLFVWTCQKKKKKKYVLNREAGTIHF